MAWANATDLIASALDGDRRALARVITRIEDGHETAPDLLAALFARGGNAYVIGLTGAPGSGKSTLTDRLISRIRAGGDEVAILAVDPSSPFTGGAILGDRIRMQDHAGDPGVYIRSMGSRGHLGGIAAATPRIVSITTVVVVNPGWGDSVQANKAGLLEIGDVFVINKADRPGLSDTVRDLRQMLELGNSRTWEPPIVPSIATKGDGVDDVWRAIDDHRKHQVSSGELAATRAHRLELEFRRAMIDEMTTRAEARAGRSALTELLNEVSHRMVDPWTAARRIVSEMSEEGQRGDE
jgi:LAO/AO transport system kinase